MDSKSKKTKRKQQHSRILGSALGHADTSTATMFEKTGISDFTVMSKLACLRASSQKV